MKAASAGLIALLSISKYVSADCWTITLNGGTVIRWTSADRDIKVGANTFAQGPAIKRGQISEGRGVQVSTLSMDITAGSDDLISGKALIPFIAGHGLDGAAIKLERAFAADFNSPFESVIRFAGKVTSINSIQGATASITISSWLILLNVNMPRNLYQAGCLHNLYDSGCGLSPASFDASGTVSGASSKQSFSTGLAMTASYYALGRIVFTSGANAGVSRTIKANTGSTITLISPLPNQPSAGDAFTIYAGCDRTQATCTSKFNNLPNFKATPFVPLPQTPLGSQRTTTTTRSGKG